LWDDECFLSKFTLKNYVFAIVFNLKDESTYYLPNIRPMSRARKYKINDFLLRLPVPQYREAIKILPRVLGISLNTFHNYRNILSNDKQDIPYEKVVMIEKLFEMRAGELINKEMRCKSLKELVLHEALSK